MQTFVALMRGINVGSARKLPMADLRALCTALGLERPQTYIQSGNLLVDAKSGGTALRRLLEKELAARFGFAVDVIVRTGRGVGGLRGCQSVRGRHQGPAENAASLLASRSA